MSNTVSRRIAVIGAGPAGLVTAKTFLQAGCDVTVYEIGTHIGGTWVYDNDNGRSRMYRNLRINTAKRYTRFSDFDFEADVPAYPDHRHMSRYLRRYAEHFGVAPRILFRHEVASVQPAPRLGTQPLRWTVATRDGGMREYDAVAVCTSPFDRPHHVSWLRESFTGEYLHSSDYRVPEPFAGKRVCVIGGGNSAVDIASDLCTVAERTVVVARSGVFVTPQYFCGMSFNEIIVRYLQTWWFPSWLRRRAVKLMVHAVHGSVTDLGFKRPQHRVHPTTSATIVADILFGRVAVKQGIKKIDGRSLQFVDGTSDHFDTVIAATGFHTAFPFLPPEVAAANGNRLNLYKRVVAPGSPGLYFIGMINLDTPINYACERQARWICEIELGNASLPTKAEMLADIAAKHAWVEKHYGGAMRHAVQEESKVYYADLERELMRGRLPRWAATIVALIRSSPS